MVTMDQAPPAYTGDKGPTPPAYGAQQQQQQPSNAQDKGCCSAYWLYWGFCFATLITWVFAVAAAVDDAYLTGGGEDGLGFEDDDVLACGVADYYDDDEWQEACDLIEAGRACQYLATVLISIVLVLVLIAAFLRAPVTGKVGLAAGIILCVFAVFQLVAFACMAAMSSIVSDSSFGLVDSGPTLGVSAVAWVLGILGAIVILSARPRATHEKDGPFSMCVAGAAGGANAQAPPPAGRASGQV